MGFAVGGSTERVCVCVSSGDAREFMEIEVPLLSFSTTVTMILGRGFAKLRRRIDLRTTRPRP